jgi:multidrug efflux pump
MPNSSHQSSFTDFFIYRPVFSWVINIIVVLLGITAFFQLSTRQYPLTESTTISVTTRMDGSGKVLEQQITKPLEDALSALQGLDSMTSTTQKGESKIYLKFKPQRSADGASADVRDTVGKAKAKSNFPENAEIEVTKGNVDSPSIMEVAVTGGGKVSLVDLYYGADSILKSSIESVPGVSTVEVFGGSEIQMNIVLDPIKMASYNITASDVSQALRNQNFQKSAGQIKEVAREFNITTQAKLKTPGEFRKVLVGKHEDRLIRISDIGVVNIEPKEEQMSIYHNSEPAVSLTIRAQSNANPVEISKEVRKRLEEYKPRLPKGTEIHIAMDKSIFIQDSINQVYRSLIEAVVLVLLVVFIFLRSAKASLVPLITIPIALIGAFFLMYLMGFTINVLSLLALVLAIGLVVDDAIIVLENIYRYMERGKKAFDAAILGTREIQFSVIAMTITLAAVYAPIALAPGVIGKVFKEFALTLAGAVILSGFTALTLSPVMCAKLLRNQTMGHHGSGHGGSGFWGYVSDAIETFFLKCDAVYLRAVTASLRKKTLILFLSAGFSIASGLIGWHYLKKELSPVMDEGLIAGRFIPAPSMNLTYIKKRASQIDTLLKKHPEIITRLMTLQSGDQSLTKSALSDWDKRDRACADIVKEINADAESVLGLTYKARCVNSSVLSSAESQYPMSFEILTYKSAEDLIKMGRLVRRELKRWPGVVRLDESEMMQMDEYEVIINRDRIDQLGIDPEEISRTLSTLVRGSDIGTFEKDARICPVHVRIAPASVSSIEGISSIFVRGKDANNRDVMVPLSEIITYSMKKGDSSIEHTAKNRTFRIDAALTPDASLADTYLAFKDHIMANVLPPEYSLEPSGELQSYFKEQGSIYFIFGLALVFIFLVMAAQFESVRDPLIILISVPLALGGALLSLLFLKSGSLNVYSQIGLITLIGLITKHGILLVDFANQAKEKGVSKTVAILESCQLRLRPILMTTFAMVLGAIPLAIATGAGSEARQQIGAVIVGGMSIGTLFTLFVVPILYVVFSRPGKHQGSNSLTGAKG